MKSPNHTTFTLIGLAFFVSVSACSDISSYNENPNETESAPTSYLLTNAQKNLADNMWSEISMGRFGNLYAQYWSMNQYSSYSRYLYVNSSVNEIWNTYYMTLINLQKIIEQNRSNPQETATYGNNANQIAVAKILKAWTFQTVTDIWGSIPLDESLKGASNPSPIYNSQQEVYAGIIQMLTEASDSIQVNEPGFTGGDVFYNGDMAKWKKFANSLKLRAAVRIADVQPDAAEEAATTAIDAGVMTSNEDNASFEYLSAPPNNNPLNELYKDRDDYAISSTLMDFMKAHDDPRISAYAAPAVNGDGSEFSGFPYGLSESNAVNYKETEPWSRPSNRVREATAPAFFMTYSESLFAEAEAAQRGWIPVDPATKYSEAIQASMNYWDVSNAETQTYLADNPYQPENWRNNLGRQKWVALYMQGLQGWFEWRRLDFGVLIPPIDGKEGVAFDQPIAVRWPYPTVEYTLNQENVETAVSNQSFSVDDQGQKVWWDTE